MTRSLKAILASMVLFASSASVAQENFTLRLAQTWGPNSPVLGETVQHMADMAETMSDGRLQIPPFRSG